MNDWMLLEKLFEFKKLFEQHKKKYISISIRNHIFYNIFWLTKTTFFQVCSGKTGLKLIKSYISNIFQMIWLRVHNKVCLVEKKFKAVVAYFWVNKNFWKFINMNSVILTRWKSVKMIQSGLLCFNTGKTKGLVKI